MARPNLLLCFDAFGTLFKPIRTAAQQYGEVARQCGVASFSDEALESSLTAAIKAEMKKNPNYGKETGLGATRWWANVINDTFTSIIAKDQTLPKDLIPRLMHRFSSKEGYETEPHLVSALKTLRHEHSRERFERIVIGVITNSDDRVPDILSSFGLDVSPLRYGIKLDPSELKQFDHDIDFHCISYDVGVEKPDKRIFDAAEHMLTQVLAIRAGKSSKEMEEDIKTWRKVYVGDEYAKDVVGATNAGWNPVLLDPDEQSESIPRLEDYHGRTVDTLFQEHPVARVRSIQNLATWFVGGNLDTAI